MPRSLLWRVTVVGVLLATVAVAEPAAAEHESYFCKNYGANEADCQQPHPAPEPEPEPPPSAPPPPSGGTGGGSGGGSKPPATSAPTTLPVTTTSIAPAPPLTDRETEQALAEALGDGPLHDYFDRLALGDCFGKTTPRCKERLRKYKDLLANDPAAVAYNDALGSAGLVGEEDSRARDASALVLRAIQLTGAAQTMTGTKLALGRMVPVLIRMQNNVRVAEDSGNAAEADSILVAMQRLVALLVGMDRKGEPPVNA